MTDHDIDARPPRTSWFAGLLFWLGTLCILVPLVLLFAIKGQGGGYNALYGAVAVLQVGVFTMPVGLVLLIAYTVIDRPWRRPIGQVWLYWLQVAGLVVLMLAVGSELLGEWRHRRQVAQDAAWAERSVERIRLIEAALAKDDDATVAREYAVCNGYCPRWRLIFDAMANHASRSLDVLVKDLTPVTYENEGFYREQSATMCRDGVTYRNDASLAGWAGTLGDRAIVERLLPLWGAEEKQAALYGAAFGNQPDIMDLMLAHGATLAPPGADDVEPHDALSQAVEAATRAGATDALAWLAAHADRPVPADNYVWVELENWINASPPSRWRGNLEPLLDALLRLGVARQERPLIGAIQRSDAVLARALIRRGIKLDDPSDDPWAGQLKTLLAGPADAIGTDDGENVKPCERASSETE
ncbi:MAG: hypothetical protein GAK28_00496 [Luteibacter sp.]|uniref:hypothetical protein n=1 Tax=Luteibacter sp. TaxID=1886636 RepID=UPI00137E72C1|nr:hypothetical protein [Luteibacter sp.]KAF1008864.1 MAG: hypothetical protein GAK28_00496 [Luteibacter sp.]